MFKKLTLDNGLRIILAPLKESLSATVMVFVEAGSKYETKETNGISHFLEHMCFKGTKNRPSQIQIANELDELGAVYNAFTSLEYTGYFIKVRNAHLEKALDIVSDIYLNQLFNEEEITKEKGVIIEEINYNQDTPTRNIWDIYLSLLYGDQPAGWDIAGTVENIKSFTRDTFVQYHKEHYVAKGTVVVIAGNFNESETIEKIKEYFSGISQTDKYSKIKIIDEQNKPAVSLKYKELDQTHLILGIRNPYNVFSEEKYALDILAEVLGGGFSSRLWQRIREKMGVAYYIGAGADLYTDHGYLAINSGVDNKRVEEVIKAVIEELKGIEGTLDDKEIERAKEHLMGNMILGLETSNQWSGFYAGQEVMTREILKPEEIIEKFKKVSKEDIQKIAREIFSDKNLNLALTGPFKEKEKFEQILKF